MRLSEWRRELALAAVVLALNLTWLGHVGLFDVDEAIFGEATREMVETRDFVTPHYNGSVRYDKPPLIYWLMAPAIKLLGPTPFAARSVSAVASALLVLLLAVAGRLLFGAQAGLAAGLVMGTCLQGFQLARWSATDMTLTLLMAVGWLALLAMSERRSTRWAIVASVALGLATLTKGPVAVVLPVASWLVWAAVTGRLGAIVRCWPLYWAKPVFWLVVLPWCVLIYRAHGWDFFKTFLLYHNLDRLLTAQSGHGAPKLTFFVVAFGGLAPWSGWSLSALVQAVRLPAAGDREGRARLYLALWFLAVLALFTASKTKLPSYITPLYPAAALLAGEALARGRVAGRVWAWLNAVPGLVIGAGLASSPLWLGRVGVWQKELSLAAPEPAPQLALAGAVLIVLALLGVAFGRAAEPRKLPLVAVCGAASWLALWLTVVPLAWHYQESTVYVMGQEAVRQMAPGDVLGTLNVHMPSLAFTTARTFHRFDTRVPALPPAPARPTPAWEELVRRQRAEADRAARARLDLQAAFASAPRLFLLTRPLMVRGGLDGIKYHVWAERLGWQLLSNQPPPPHYKLPPSPWTAPKGHP